MNKLCFLFLLIPVVVFGQNMSDDYVFDCEFKNIFRLTDDGGLQKSQFMENLIGEHFAVNRKTGAILGSGLTTILADKETVINHGGSSNSYKAFAEFSVGQGQLIEIQVFRENNYFPFIALSMGGVGLATGLCK